MAPTKPSKLGPETKTKPKTRARDSRKIDKGAGRGVAKLLTWQAGDESYAQRLAAFREHHGEGWKTEDILAASMMEIELIGLARELAGTRTVLLRLALDCRKQLHIEDLAGKGVFPAVSIITGPQSPPPGATDPPEIP